MLEAIIEGLDAEIRWPDAAERAQLASRNDGIFRNCIGITDCWEQQIINNSKDSVKESNTFSGKADNNTKKVFAVIDFDGYFRYAKVDIDGRPNDRQVYTESDLYLDRGAFFGPDEWIAADGIFEGDGSCGVSYTGREMHNDESKQEYNVIFTEVRKYIETAFGRVQNWFQILRNKDAEWSCDDHLLAKATLAAIRLHNWMLRNRNLNYNPSMNPKNMFRQDY